ncbi:hypothetical protein F5887DRAFT_925730 [Amanita rubescens]|nr:hypothetical protein F5887DRAFT_925730 [Amanita rubescens]
MALFLGPVIFWYTRGITRSLGSWSVSGGWTLDTFLVLKGHHNGVNRTSKSKRLFLGPVIFWYTRGITRRLGSWNVSGGWTLGTFLVLKGHHNGVNRLRVLWGRIGPQILPQGRLRIKRLFLGPVIFWYTRGITRSLGSWSVSGGWTLGTFLVLKGHHNGVNRLRVLRRRVGPQILHQGRLRVKGSGFDDDVWDHEFFLKDV